MGKGEEDGLRTSTHRLGPSPRQRKTFWTGGRNRKASKEIKWSGKKKKHGQKKYTRLSSKLSFNIVMNRGKAGVEKKHLVPKGRTTGFQNTKWKLSETGIAGGDRGGAQGETVIETNIKTAGFPPAQWMSSGQKTSKTPTR